MGAWGFGVFDDDTALDEAGDFATRPSLARLARMLDAATAKTYSNEVVASRALVAAEVVAALRGRPSPELPTELSEWVQQHGAALPELKRSALLAVATVVRSSEVRDVWEDAGSLRQWRKAMSDLKRRLSGSARRPRGTGASQESDEEPTGPAPEPGATYLIPLDDGYLGACRVIRPAVGDDLLGLMSDLPPAKREERARLFVVVVTTPWVGKAPPSLDEPELRRVLRLTHHEWQDAPQIYVGPVEVPPDYQLVGIIPPTDDEKRLKGVLSTTWTSRGQQLLQKEWDEEHGVLSGGTAVAEATNRVGGTAATPKQGAGKQLTGKKAGRKKHPAKKKR